MKKIIQYIMLSIALLMTVSQSIHNVLEHSLERNKKELSNKFSDSDSKHICFACSHDLQVINHELKFHLFEWSALLISKYFVLYSSSIYKENLHAYKNLRAPPYLI